MKFKTNVQIAPISEKSGYQNFQGNDTGFRIMVSTLHQPYQNAVTYFNSDLFNDAVSSSVSTAQNNVVVSD
jgi:hypothetical protein